MVIEKYLVLNKYLLSLFKVDDFRDLQEKLKDASVGVDSDGRSNFINIIGSAFENLKISKETLLRYDENIQNYVKKISYKREQITLKYFQYLAVLFTEIFLDNLKDRKAEFLNCLNTFLNSYKNGENIKIIDEFKDEDLKKIAFWMATGSGKTLIMHINYYQFLNYGLFSPDNIILITPNEGLSKQHFEELQKSGIPARLYSGSLNEGMKYDNEVLVIEMTKFVEEKKGGGVTLPVDTFEGKNLIFVDEGHKGKKAEEQKWAKLRDKLAEKGFVFEYSATFGQILSESQKEILKEYAKSIIFDYSYKYFYLDGYGKDFSVLNVKQNNLNEKDFMEKMFIANLLSFYEQLLVYEENKTIAKDYNIEKPLWIFVGTSVTGKGEESDVIQIVEFIKRVMQDEEWVEEQVNKILSGDTGLKDENGEDVFKNRFDYIKDKTIDKDDLYRRIFGGKGAFCIYELKNAEGEFGLKVGENDYFGVINIGDASGFRKELEKKGISVQQEAISSSLFDTIKREDSSINILIGSKKFIEGWDTWRVSSMGLLNIGKGEGPQIIQLFGRGVRLKGKGMSLKRSYDKKEVRFLETLNIYGIKADYLTKFLEAISKEEVEFEKIEIPVQYQHEEKWQELYIPSKSQKKFEDVLRLKIENEINYKIDLSPKLLIYQSKERKENGIKAQRVSTNQNGIKFPERKIDLLDWQKIYLEILQFKRQRNYFNLVFNIETLKNILRGGNYKIFGLSEIFKVKSYEDVERLEEIALLIIKKYIDLFYAKKAKDFETQNLKYEKFNQPPLPFVSEKKQGYIIEVEKKEKKLIEGIKKLLKDLNKIKQNGEDILPHIYMDKSLYIPLLLQSKNIKKISPPPLVESERIFINKLKKFLNENRSIFSQIEIYLLRNYPTSGTGFQLKWSKFYPDFIMWIKNGGEQTIVFIDPKGLEHTRSLDDEKIQFSKEIKEIERKIKAPDGCNISLESFIFSITPYNNLIKGLTNPPLKNDYENNNVLFLEDVDCIKLLFKKLNVVNE